MSAFHERRALSASFTDPGDQGKEQGCSGTRGGTCAKASVLYWQPSVSTSRLLLLTSVLESKGPIGGLLWAAFAKTGVKGG